MTSSELAADPNRRAGIWTTGERGRLSREQVAEVQRARIMRAAAQVVAEHGFSGASITQVAKAAGVSRATFYDLFENFEQCFLTVLDAAMRRTSARIAQAFAQNATWEEQAVAGLAALLSALDAQPLPRARLPGGGTRGGTGGAKYHAREIELLKHVVNSAAGPARTGRHSSTLSAEATVVAVAGILHRRLHHRRGAPVHRPAGAAREPRAQALLRRANRDASARTRETTRARALHKTRRAARDPRHGHGDPKSVIQPASPPRPGMPELPGRPPGSEQPRARKGNRPHPRGAGGEPLLARLASQGLLVKRTGRPGHPNAWSLTPHGEQVAKALEDCT